MNAVIADWTAAMERDHNAIAYLDVRRGNTLFRVYLLRNSLQVDIAFWTEAEFGATSPTFKIAFGTAAQHPRVAAAAPAEFIGMAWLYALHVRSSVARGRLWQAEYMLSAMRDQVLALACLRHGLNTRDGRGFDDLPAEVRAALIDTFVGAVEAAELTRAFSDVMATLIAEVDHVDSAAAKRLAPTLDLLVLT